MNGHNPDDLSHLSMLELFRVEAENQIGILTSNLLELERGSSVPESLETLMRAAHSLKGAARIVNLQVAVRMAHAMEDCFVAAQKGSLLLRHSEIDMLLRGIDLLAHISRRTEADVGAWEKDHAVEVDGFLESLRQLTNSGPVMESRAGDPAALPAATSTEPGLVPIHQEPPARSSAGKKPARRDRPSDVVPARKPEAPDRELRLTAENLNRLLGLAGESLVESRWLRPFANSLLRLKRTQADLAQGLEHLRQSMGTDCFADRGVSRLNELSRKLAEAQQFLAERMLELETFDRRSAHLSHRLYLEVLRTRMRSFGDGVRRFPRMVRDLARSLDKRVTLVVTGENTPVDRDILDRLETPLAHLLRNAVDHGCESREERERAGKPVEGTIQLDARHSAGTLLVTVTDDGAAIDTERLRKAIVQKRLSTPGAAERLTEAELLQFLFLPGFSLKDKVTEISGRGVGLDVVQDMVRGVRGAIRIINHPGQSLRFQLQLPLTLSVLRALLVEVGGEPYAFPLNQIARTLTLPRTSIEELEGRHHFHSGDRQVGLLTAHQVLECGEPKQAGGELPVVLLGDHQAPYGLVVDRFLGERELVVQPLDSRLGKVRDINAAALMEDGAPVLVVDVDDMVRSIGKLLAEGMLARVPGGGCEPARRKTKRVLAVDDSLTVRELERKLLTNRGYLADVAVDGIDGWNALHRSEYDLVITDIDMPRMDGIELATLIKRDPQLKSLPVLIVSYKDREEDRMRGLEAGADYYLTKGSFQDETLLEAVVDLIGEPEG